MLAIPDNCTAIPEEPEGGAGSVITTTVGFSEEFGFSASRGELRLDFSIITLVSCVIEICYHYRTKNTNNGDNHQKLNQRKTYIICLHVLC